MAKRPNVLIMGNDPNCIHYEDIVGLIGTCRKCGQVRDYRPCLLTYNENVSREHSRRGQESRRKYEAARREKAAV